MATQVTLGGLMTDVRDRADMLPQNYTPSTTNQNYFVSDPQLIKYINRSMLELYDLLITVYEDYYVAPRLVFQTDGTTQLYNLPNGTNYSGAPALYKLFGVDLGLDNSKNAFVTLKKFDFIARNSYVFPQLNTTFLGVFNLRYRLVGGQLMFIPTPSANQNLGMWYFPQLPELAATTDILDSNMSMAGWDEYIIVDATMKCAKKEESWELVQSLGADKLFLKDRIESSAMNRDAGQPDTISDSRSRATAWGSPNGDGPYGGY